MTTEPAMWTEVINPKTLAKKMDDRRLSVRDLTELANRYLSRNKRRGQKPLSWEKSTIGRLRNGTRKNLHPDLATAIAEVLEVPRDYLFTERVSTYNSDTGRKAA